MSKNKVATLLEKYQLGTCTTEEKARVDEWIAAHGMPETSFERMSVHEQENWTEALFADIQRANQVKTKTVFRKLYPYMAAASIIIIVGTAILFFRAKPEKQQANDVAPFTAQVILKTGHGRTILLDPAKKGQIVQQGYITVNKTAVGQIAYSGTDAPTEMVYDTLQVPAGGRPYEVKLADGSKITLNAATTLRFPESFSATKREMVELISGEIYGVIKHNARAPLQIKAPSQLITDIGTEFDISAYPDEADARATLVEGAIVVTAGSVTKALKPGQQTILTANNFVVAAANIDQVTAWKNGDFSFNGEHIDAIMRQLARWYNIEVKYEGKMASEVFYGRITRKKNISEVLRMLEKTQKIHFKVEGRRVTVLSK